MGSPGAHFGSKLGSTKGLSYSESDILSVTLVLGYNIATFGNVLHFYILF